MENLRYSATNGCEGTYDVLHLPTGYEPNGHDFNELQNSSVSYEIPAADQAVDDLTLGEMLTEAYRGQVDYFLQEGVSVSRRRRLKGSIDQGNLMEKWSIDQGKMMSVTARKHRLALYLKSKD